MQSEFVVNQGMWRDKALRGVLLAGVVLAAVAPLHKAWSRTLDKEPADSLQIISATCFVELNKEERIIANAGYDPATYAFTYLDKNMQTQVRRQIAQGGADAAEACATLHRAHHQRAQKSMLINDTLLINGPLK